MFEQNALLSAQSFILDLSSLWFVALCQRSWQQANDFWHSELHSTEAHVAA